ncbi:uncharacterized protein [Procambarus clarkii]|uniref:uncharacterized protein n=1 Tax=Procambarus clarkii TaxID=6728 RepID=UPI0037442526
MRVQKKVKEKLALYRDGGSVEGTTFKVPASGNISPLSAHDWWTAALRSEVTSKEELVEQVFPIIQTNYKNHDSLNERTILVAKNNDVYELNNIVQSNIQSKAVTYKSVDTVKEADEAVNYQTEFLNSLEHPGIPSHVRQSKIGVPIIMLQNINQSKLCNATSLGVKKLISNVEEATILTRPFKESANQTISIPPQTMKQQQNIVYPQALSN